MCKICQVSIMQTGIYLLNRSLIRVSNIKGNYSYLYTNRDIYKIDPSLEPLTSKGIIHVMVYNVVTIYKQEVLNGFSLFLYIGAWHATS